MKRIVRVITSNYCVPAHLHNTLKRIPEGVELFIIGEKVSAYAEVYGNVNFIDLPLRRNFSFFEDIYTIIMLISHFRKIKPDIVHSLMTKAGLFAAIAGRLAGVRIRVHTFTGQVWANKTGVSKAMLKLVDRIICNLNTDCLTDSPSQSEFLFLNGIKKNSEPLKCLVKGSLSGVDLVRFNRPRLLKNHEELKKTLQFRESDFVIGYIARKSLDKGCIDILEIFSTIKKTYPFAKLIYVGPDESDGQVRDFLNEHASLKESITELGFVHNHEDYLVLCCILCLPSYREGFGSIVIDAAALGIPTVGYNIDGLVDSIADNLTGKLVEPGNKDEFAKKVKYFIENPIVLQQYSNSAMEYAESFFDADLLNKELYQYYQRLGV